MEPGGQSLFVIGDPDQAIYGFRGAGADCFDRLKEDLPGLQEIRLVQNYRSTPQILSAALSAISPNPGPVRTLLPNRPDGDPVRLIAAPSDLSEGIAVARQIAFMTGGLGMLEAHNAEQRRVVRSFSDIAVLCRTHRRKNCWKNVCGMTASPAWSPAVKTILPTTRCAGTIGFFGWLLHGQDTLALENAPAPDLALPCRRGGTGGQGRLPGTKMETSLARCVPRRRLTLIFFPSSGRRKLLCRWCGRKNPRRLLECWLDKKHVSPAMEKLQNAAVFLAIWTRFIRPCCWGGKRIFTGRQEKRMPLAQCA